MGVLATVIICIIVLITPIVLLSLSLVTQNPRLYVEDLYVPGLINSSTSQSSNATRLNTFIFIDLKLENLMPLNGIHYGEVNLTFFYGGNRTHVANYTVPKFYQGHKKTAHKRLVVRTREMPWEDAFQAVSSGSNGIFGVELATTVKLGRFGIYREKKALAVNGNMEVDRSGELVNGKTVRLR